jgi:hypothetical protein|tara:strand:+ start:272 stop:616 length:345 start_codon:yes stop_codon:yes gene_type:complete
MLTKETLSKYERNPTLKVPVDTDTPMKEWLVNYVGEHFAAEKERFEEAMGQEFKWDGSVTVEMVAELMIREFPDFMLAIAEENFMRGYRQALSDVEYTEDLERHITGAEDGPQG